MNNPTYRTPEEVAEEWWLGVQTSSKYAPSIVEMIRKDRLALLDAIIQRIKDERHLYPESNDGAWATIQKVREELEISR